MRVVLRCFLSFFLFLKEENKRGNYVRLCEAGWSQPLEVKPRDRNRGSGRTTASVKKPLYVVDREPRWFRVGWREGFGRDMNSAYSNPNQNHHIFPCKIIIHFLSLFQVFFPFSFFSPKLGSRFIRRVEAGSVSAFTLFPCKLRVFAFLFCFLRAGWGWFCVVFFLFSFF